MGPMDFGQSSPRQIRRRNRPPKGGGAVWKSYGRGDRNEAEKEGFEPSRQGFSPPNALAGRRLQPLGHFSGPAQDTARSGRPLRRECPFGGRRRWVTASTMTSAGSPLSPASALPVCGFRRRASPFKGSADRQLRVHPE